LPHELAESPQSPMTAQLDKQARVRLDKWLWAARFFKTRSQATSAVTGGKVHVNGHRIKAAHGLKVGDELHITKGSVTFEVVVRGLSEKRGPAKQAEALYEETEASRQAREKAALERKAARLATPVPKHRPDKRDRRRLRQFKYGR